MRRFGALTGMLLLSIIAVGGCETMFVDRSGTEEGAVQDFVSSGRTSSFFRAVQIDPRSEDSAGPQVLDAGDIDGDGMMDLVSAWNQSQPVQIHLQRRDAAGNITFLTVPIAGTSPIARVTDVKLADMDQDGRLDIVVLIKDTGLLALCDPERDDCDFTANGGVVDGAIEGGIIIFYGPADAVNDIWEPAILEDSFYAGTDGNIPEEGGYTGLDVGDLDGRRGPDIVVAFNSAEGDPMINRIDIYMNPGGAGSRDDNAWERTNVFEDLPTAKDVALLDVDRDGDLDIIGTFPTSKRSNVFWLPNPLDIVGAEAVAATESWIIFAPIGRIDSGADTIAIGDVDGDGIRDVVVRSGDGRLVQWFQSPAQPSRTFIRNPWRVYTLAEFVDRRPQAIAVGDLTGNGQLEAVVAAEGAIIWFESASASSIFDHWAERLIIDEGPPEMDVSTIGLGATGIVDPMLDPTTQTIEETGTLVNALLVVDLDGDGANDVVGTIDRNELSGLANDALIWFQSTR